MTYDALITRLPADVCARARFSWLH